MSKENVCDRSINKCPCKCIKTGQCRLAKAYRRAKAKEAHFRAIADRVLEEIKACKGEDEKTGGA